ncbi:MAG: IclR family transcriptional regulator [Proteobacteria bacterium]|nr:IclR family transcriptional regulator [Pseudomonadota bacterium]
MRKSAESSRGNSTASRSAPQSVGRIFSILNLLAEGQAGATLSELAIGVGAPKTSLVGLLAGLTEDGIVKREGTGRYILGPAFISLAMRTVAGRELVTLARPFLSELVELTGETAVIGTLATDPNWLVYLDKVESTNPIRYAVEVGEQRELYCTALGKVLLAYFDSGKLKSYLKSTKRIQFTGSTLTEKSQLSSEVALIKDQGLSRTRDERISGASGLAAPVFSGDGEVIAGLLIAGPSDRMNKNAKNNEKHLRKVAVALTRVLGGARGGEKT